MCRSHGASVNTLPPLPPASVPATRNPSKPLPFIAPQEKVLSRWALHFSRDPSGLRWWNPEPDRPPSPEQVRPPNPWEASLEAAAGWALHPWGLRFPGLVPS